MAAAFARSGLRLLLAGMGGVCFGHTGMGPAPEHAVSWWRGLSYCRATPSLPAFFLGLQDPSTQPTLGTEGHDTLGHQRSWVPNVGPWTALGLLL